ncbi:MAG: HlyD family efflux transporter periplasmic adaptor subunit [Anaerolineae bacterium]
MADNRSSTPADATANQDMPVAGGRRNPLGRIVKSPLFIGVLVLLVAAGGYFGFRYWQDQESRISIETSEISAPVISIGPDVPGVLKAVYVKEGDRVVVGQQLFNVGDRVVSARVPGIIVSVQNTPGQFASNQTPIVQMYDPASLRLVGHLQEDQGLGDVKIGQKVMFTLDAYDNREYEGTVDSIAKTADQGSVVFSISDKRQEKLYDIKVTFDPNHYPEIVNGMSARMWIYK